MKKQLPARPNLEHLKKEAKAVLKQGAAATLAEAQRMVAELYGFRSWATLRRHVLARQDDGDTERAIQLLREAAGSGNGKQLGELLDAYPEIIDDRSGPGARTALHFAVIGDQEDAVRLLLERGADPNARCEGVGATALHIAAERGNRNIARLLLDHGAIAASVGDCHELGVIGWACCFGNGNPEMVHLLLERGAEHHIFSAVAAGATGAIRELVARDRAQLERRMDVTNQRRRPLHLAVVKGRMDSLQTLLELGADCELLDQAGLTALDEAAFRGERAMMERLLSRGAEMRLPAAVAMGRVGEIGRLLRQDPECLKPGKQWGTLIVRAVEKAPREIISLLLQMGASVTVRGDPMTALDSSGGYTPLHAAAFHGNLGAVEVLLECGADVRARDAKHAGTPAAWAACAGHKKVCARILEGPIDVFDAIEMGLAERLPEILRSDPEALQRPFEKYVAHPFEPAPSLHAGSRADAARIRRSHWLRSGRANSAELGNTGRRRCVIWGRGTTCSFTAIRFRRCSVS